jgi:hypothetical protein
MVYVCLVGGYGSQLAKQDAVSGRARKCFPARMTIAKKQLSSSVIILHVHVIKGSYDLVCAPQAASTRQTRSWQLLDIGK